jgi:hypothetical protein
MVLLLNAWAALLVTLSLALLVLQLVGTMAALGVKLSAVPAVLLVLAIGRGVHFTVHLCLVSCCHFFYGPLDDKLYLLIASDVYFTGLCCTTDRCSSGVGRYIHT